MARHVWSVLCSRSILDKDMKDISLIGVLESLKVQIDKSPRKGSTEITPQLRMELVSLWEGTEREPEKIEIQGRLLAPDGSTIIEHAFGFEVNLRAKSIMRFETIRLEKEGRFQALVDLRVNGEWLNVAQISLDVSFETIEIPRPKKTRRSTKS